MNEQPDRDAIIREIAKKKVVVTIPGMESLPVRRNLAYRDDLLMDIYYPGPEAASRRSSSLRWGIRIHKAPSARSAR